MAPTTETIVGVFAHVDTTVRALEELKAKGYHDLTGYTPGPVHEIEDGGGGGPPGGFWGFVGTFWWAMQWTRVPGGKPIASLPPFVVIAFELTILFGGIATLIGMVVLGRLPKFRPSPGFDPRFTRDRFGVAVHCAPDRGGAVRGT